MELYCLSGKQKTDKQLNNLRQNKKKRFTETVYENISFYIYDGATIIFGFKDLEKKKYSEIKDYFVGRLIPPYITRIQQRYAYYFQRQGVPRIPEEALPDFAITETREQGGIPELMDYKGCLSKMIQIIPTYPDSIHRSEVMKRINAELRNKGHQIPERLEETIQSVYSKNCEGYSAFEKKRALFKLQNKGDGKWSVHPDYRMPSLDDS